MTTLRKSIIVGKPLIRVEGQHRLTGAARYVDDLDFGPDLLQAHIVRSTRPHALLLSVDTDLARSLPGVVAVLTGEDLPGMLGQNLRDRPVLARDRVRYAGEPVAVVVATTAEQAVQAAQRVAVSYQDLPGVFDLASSLSPGAPLVHPGAAQYDRTQQVIPQAGSNIAHHCMQERGDLLRGWGEAAVVLEHTYQAPPVQHVAMEPHGGVAQIDAEGHVTLWASTQAPFAQRDLIAHALGLEPDHLRVVTPYVGGGFGGKTFVSIEALLVAAAMAVAGRPVKLVLSRLEDFTSTFRRPGLRAELKMGVSAEGLLTAVEARYLWDAGASADAIIDLAWAAMLAGTGPYRTSNVHIESSVVYTNRPISAPMRGNGMSEVHWAVEQHIDRLAAALQIDPVEFRLRNGLKGGDAIGEGLVMHTTGLDQCIRKAAAGLRTSKAPAKSVNTRRGRGLAAMWSPVFGGRGTLAAAAVKLTLDGRIVVELGGIDTGQGLYTVVVQLVAATLGVPTDWVKVAPSDTNRGLTQLPAADSHLTWSAGNAVLKAAQSVRAQVLERAARNWSEPVGALDIMDGFVLSHATDRTATLFDVAYGDESSARSAVTPLIAGEGIFPPAVAEDSAAAYRPISHFSTGAQAAEVEVDIETGEVEVLQLVSAFDVGHALNPDLVLSQIKGGAMQGLSTTLFEHLRLDEGISQNPGFLDYRVATALDLPQTLEAVIVEVPQGDGPYGARGIGEHSLVPTAPAIANAVYDAIGVRISELPITGESVWRAIQTQLAFETKS